MSSEIPGLPVDMTPESLAERLREGPLRTMLTLHVRAGTLATLPEKDSAQRLEKLVELAQLAHMAMAQFQGFMGDLERLVDRLAIARRETR
jgi:hypothetical protein